MLTTGREKGFVLLELLIALIILSIVTAIILPSFDRLMNSVEGKTTQRKLINLFQQARSRAITSNSPQTIRVVGNRLVYQIGEETFEISRGIKKISLKNNPDREISFSPDGTSSGGALIFITRNNHSFQIRIDPVTGAAQSGGS